MLNSYTVPEKASEFELVTSWEDKIQGSASALKSELAVGYLLCFPAARSALQGRAPYLDALPASGFRRRDLFGGRESIERLLLTFRWITLFRLSEPLIWQEAVQELPIPTWKLSYAVFVHPLAATYFSYSLFFHLFGRGRQAVQLRGGHGYFVRGFSGICAVANTVASLCLSFSWHKNWTEFLQQGGPIAAEARSAWFNWEVLRSNLPPIRRALPFAGLEQPQRPSSSAVVLPTA